MATRLDILILGGGIAGLWVFRALEALGYEAALVETARLGSGQTIASQGIIHAGAKYALTGQAAGASRAAGRASAIWRACLAGAGPIDLSGAQELSPHTHMFTTPGVGSRLTGLAASKALAVGPVRLPRGAFPPPFREASPGVDVYQLDEPVLDTGSVLRAISDPVRRRIALAETVTLGGDPSRPLVRLRCDGVEAELAPSVLVLAAGAGNEPLLASLGVGGAVRMQRRALHMVMARSPGLPRLFAHCIGLSDKPRATITTAPDNAGRNVWYVGGQPAESGVDRSRDDQIAAVRAELHSMLPWVDLSDAEWAAFRIDRAEGFDAAGQRPDVPVVRREGNVIACWPTKLVLAPLAAEAVAGAISDIRPSRTVWGGIDTASPSVAAAPWDEEGPRWTR